MSWQTRDYQPNLAIKTLQAAHWAGQTLLNSAFGQGWVANDAVEKLGIYFTIYRINSLLYSLWGSSAKKSSSSFLVLNPLILWRYSAAVLWFSISSLLCLLMFKKVSSWSIPKNRLLARLAAMPFVLLPVIEYLFKSYRFVKPKDFICRTTSTFTLSSKKFLRMDIELIIVIFLFFIF